jgi:hypothetical protein
MLPPAIPAPESSGDAEALDVEVAVGDEAPPLALEVTVLLAVPPAPAVGELLFVPEPPAPPLRVTLFELVAELVCVTPLDCVFELLPEFVAVAPFVWLVAP